MRRRGEATGLCGILAVDKPAGMTSHDVVASVRRATGEQRVGHAGTLDPLATGLLVLLVGPATRLAQYLSAAKKSYAARIAFGVETDTDDATGEPTRDALVPPDLAVPARARSVVDGLLGVHEQLPPAYSAIKREGRIAHREARSGRSLDLAPRTVEIFETLLSGVEPGPPLMWDVTLAISKGTYVRAIARDLGRSLDTAAHLVSLRRITSGSLHLESAYTLDEILDAGDDIDVLFSDPLAALALPFIIIDASDAERVSVGQPLDIATLSAEAFDGTPVAIADSKRLLGIYRYDRSLETLAPEVVIPGGVNR